jgi:hypothetical protein
MPRLISAVNYPRSGHHLLVNALARYFSDDLTLDSNRKAAFTAGELAYCEYYSHCRTVPCGDPRTNLQKNHDFQLRLGQEEQAFYLVQIRDPMPAITSRFELEVACGRIQDSRQRWEEFARSNVEYWRGFRHKWVRGKKSFSRLIIDYDDLITDPASWVRAAVGYSSPGHTPEEGRLGRVIESLDVGRKSEVESFRFHDEGQFTSWKANAWRD